MRTKHKRIDPGLKAKAALAAVREDCTASQLASKFGVHATQIGHWKRRLVERAAELFSDDYRRESQDQETLIADLYEQIGRLQMEQAWLKKNLPSSIEEKRSCIEPKHPGLSIRRQCELLGLNRSTWYVKPAEPDANELALCVASTSSIY